MQSATVLTRFSFVTRLFPARGMLSGNATCHGWTSHPSLHAHPWTVRDDSRTVFLDTKQVTLSATMMLSKVIQKICTKKVFCPNLSYLSKFFPPSMLNYWFIHSFHKKWRSFLKCHFSFLLYSYIGKSSVILHKTNSSFCWWHIGGNTFTHVHAHTHTFYTSLLQKTKLAS